MPVGCEGCCPPPADCNGHSIPSTLAAAISVTVGTCPNIAGLSVPLNYIDDSGGSGFVGWAGSATYIDGSGQTGEVDVSMQCTAGIVIVCFAFYFVSNVFFHTLTACETACVTGTVNSYSPFDVTASIAFGSGTGYGSCCTGSTGPITFGIHIT